MKKIIALVLALVLVFALCACGSTGSSDTQTPASSAPEQGAADNSASSGDSDMEVVKIGVFEPSTGDSASGGKKEILGMQYANSETPTVEVGGKTYKVELVIADNGSSTDKAPSAASELVSKDVVMVLGSYGSGVSMAGGPKFEEAGIAAMGVTCTNPNVTAGNDYYFRICFLDNFQADVLASFGLDKFDAKVAYCLGESGNEYDQGLIAFFKQVFEAAGGTVITDSFPTNNSDFTSYLNKAKSEGADVIFTPVSIAYATQILSQAASLGIEAPFLGSDTLDDNMVLEAVKGTNIKLYVSTFYQEGGSEAFDAGIKEYINNNQTAKDANGGNDTISAVTAMGYDAYYVALEAIKAAGSVDKADILAAMPGVTYTGVSGSIAFDDVGDAIRDTAYIKTADTANGTWVLETVQTGSSN
jgi:branched-chain amino acid transport system substrate-binding protein